MPAVQLRPGTRLVSVACATEVIVVKASPIATEISCGGQPMVLAERGVTRPSSPPVTTEGTQLGKRYVDVDGSVELLCTKPGQGSLSINGVPLSVKAAKLLPSSD